MIFKPFPSPDPSMLPGQDSGTQIPIPIGLVWVIFLVVVAVIAAFYQAAWGQSKPPRTKR